MSKKWMVVAGVALAAVVLVAGLIAMSRKTPSLITIKPDGSSSSTNATGTSAGQGTTTTAAAGTTTPPKTTTTGGTKAVPPAGAPKPFPAIPDPGIPAQEPKAPASQGATLAPLTSAPDPTISGLALAAVPEGAKYTIRMRPLGIGPSIVLGSRLVIRVDSATPVGQAPANSSIVNANVLALADTTHGGMVTKGGTYTAILAFSSDGEKMLPILSEATLAK